MNKKLISLLLLGLLLVSAIMAHGGHSHHHSDDESDEEEGKAPSAVINLTEDTIQEIITEHDVTLIMFFAPWCGHCKNLKPHFEAAANDLAANEKIALAKVDCTQQQDLCTLNKVKYYPTLVLYKNGVPEPWEGERTTEGIKESLLSELLPPVTSIETEEDLAKFNEDNTFGVVGFFDNDHDDRYTLFQSTVGKLKKFAKFGAVINKALATKFSEKSPSIVAFKKGEEPIIFGEEELTEESLTKFVRVNVLPVLGEINANTYKKYDGTGLPLVYVFVDPKNKDVKEAALASATTAAKKTVGKVVFCWVDHGKYPQQAKYLGLSGDVVPAAAMEDANKGNKYLLDEKLEFTTENVDAWIKEYLEGKLEPFVKSEAIPESNDGPVKVVVGKTYNELVLDTTKDVLLEVYAPWCGHCKNLAPIYEKLGKHFSGVDSVVIAKCDATANDLPAKLGVTGFPTILMFPANNKDEPVQYEGPRELDTLIEFVTSKASIAIPEITKVEEKEVAEEKEVNTEKKQAKHDEL